MSAPNGVTRKSTKMRWIAFTVDQVQALYDLVQPRVVAGEPERYGIPLAKLSDALCEEEEAQ